jgi:hypothetical protein
MGVQWLHRAWEQELSSNLLTTRYTRPLLDSYHTHGSHWSLQIVLIHQLAAPGLRSLPFCSPCLLSLLTSSSAKTLTKSNLLAETLVHIVTVNILMMKQWQSSWFMFYYMYTCDIVKWFIAFASEEMIWIATVEVKLVVSVQNCSRKQSHKKWL